MKYLYTFCLFFITTFFYSESKAQGQFTTSGKEFYLSFGNNLGHNATGVYLELKLVSLKATRVNVVFKNNTTLNKTINLVANQVYSYILSANEKSAVYNQVANNNSNLTMYIESLDEPISVFAFNQSPASSDATAVLPVSNYGMDYYHMSYLNIGAGTGDGFIIIAKEDNTKITVDGVISNHVLSKGQAYVYYLISADMTGKKVTADKPVAFFVNNSCVRVPNNGGACDCLVEQLVPVSSWGNNFLAAVTVRGTERIRLIASQNGTVVKQDGVTIQTLNAGQFLEREITKNTYFQANKPVAVGTYLVGENWNGAPQGDPALAWVPSIEQNVAKSTIAAFMPQIPNPRIVNHYVLIVAPTPNKSETKVNGGSLSGGTWSDHALSGYSVYNMKLTEATPYTFENNKGLVIVGYGYGSYESYSYLAASSARKLDASFYITNKGNKYHYQDANLSVPFDCGSPFTFEAVIQYDLHTSAGHIKWYVDDVEDVSARDLLTWTKPYLSGGNHKVKLVIKDSYGEVEELETTLKVECATDMTPKNAAIFEGDQVKMTIALGAGNAPVAMEYTLSAAVGSTAVATDYSFPSKVTIPAGSNKVEFYVQATTDDIINEPDILLKLQAKTDGYPALISDITIKDKVTAANKALSLTATPLVMNEPHTGHTTTPNATTFTLSLPSPIKTNTAIRVNLGYTGTATMDTDYTLSAATAKTYVEIPANASMASFTLTAKEDNLYEEKEFVTVTPTPAAGYTMSTGAITVDIMDKTPSDIIVATLLDAEESATSVTGKFQIRFKKASVTTKKQIMVMYKLTGVANDGTVYDLISPTEAIIPIDSYYKDVQIKPKNNFVVEGAREVKIELLSVTSI